MSDSRLAILENVIKQMLTPLKGLPFDLVLESISGQKLLPIQESDEALIASLERAAHHVHKALLATPILSRRVNEVGNYIEPFVKNALIAEGLHVETPAGLSGKKKSTGYPDLLILDTTGNATYLECKTYNEDSIETSLRAFYLSPSDDFKVSRDARHLLIAFEMVVTGQQGALNIYQAKSYKLLSLENLLLDVKYEFNASNKGLYKETKLLKTGIFQ